MLMGSLKQWHIIHVHAKPSLHQRGHQYGHQGSNK
jgi:hypothetical protein